MPTEKSAGAIVYLAEGRTRLYLLLHYEEGHWDFPKGKMEKGESEEETIRREVREETGITDIDFKDFREGINYSFRRDGETVYKEVIFRLARTKEKEVKLSFEHTAYKWLPYEEALGQLTYDNAKELLKKAHGA
jgi:8-oxo-dGTP pyrophosphatase MutT (NUDIX family)